VATARTFTVTSTADAHDATAGDGNCDSPSGCTLRAAIEDANLDSGLSAIVVPTGTYTLSLGELLITAPAGMQITGSGIGLTVISGGNASRVFNVGSPNGSLVTISRLTAKNGLAPLDGGGNPDNGGAVLVQSTSAAMLDSVEVSDSTTAVNGSVGSGNGGGIATLGNLWLLNSLVHNNTANATGGGLWTVGAAWVEHTLFDHNTAQSNNGSIGGGGVGNSNALTLVDSTMSSNTGAQGGGISNEGQADLNRVVFTGNSATRVLVGGGGGIVNFGTMHIAGSTVRGNGSAADGGGVAHYGSSLTVLRSTISNNTAAAEGGGVYVVAQGLQLDDVTISGNSANTGGGALTHAPMSLRNVTVAGNSGTGLDGANAGGVDNPQANLRDTIVAANTGGNCGSALGVRSLGHNLDDGTTCGFSGPGDISNRDAHLGPLADNGGLTQTMALLVNSPAIDAGDGSCSDTDQRGVTRPQGPACDIGAFELAPYYWEVAADGGIFSFGGAPFYGSTGSMHLNKPIVGMAPTPDGKGYWLVASDGGIFSFGNAGFFGSTGAITLNQPIVGMAATPNGKGYWLVASDGGIFAFGNAGFFGSTGAMKLNQPVVGMGAEPDGKGYFLVASDGGVFTFGSAQSHFHGSAGGIKLNKPVVGMAVTPDGDGYWLVATDGGIFTYGSGGFYGSAGGIRLNKPVVGMAATPSGKGYWLVATDGGIFTYGDAHFFGSMGGTPLNQPVVGMGAI
jgi:CSLREA domain-containing protein